MKEQQAAFLALEDELESIEHLDKLYFHILGSMSFALFVMAVSIVFAVASKEEPVLLVALISATMAVMNYKAARYCNKSRVAILTRVRSRRLLDA